ncbi:MAG: hypothetical protein JRN62_03435 [Nitrososphaerota archaeon]|nr:hypothetical protein [Nitrososphaerota archaeon]MDG6948652.1 hypothetical protein [Nitrososphaerota archaeon]
MTHKVSKVGTFAIDTKQEVMYIPEWHHESDIWPYIHEFVVHEYNHTRICGIPYTYIEGKRLQAAIMAGLKSPYGNEKLPRGVPADLLNIIGDAVNNIFIHGKTFDGHTFDMRTTQESWVKRFPPTKQDDSAGTAHVDGYYVLNLVFQHFFGGNILTDNTVPARKEFKKLVSDIKGLVVQARTNPATKDTQLVVDAAKMIWELTDHNENDSKGPCMVPRKAEKDELDKLAEIAVEFGLDAEDLIDLTEDPDLTTSEAAKLLSKARRIKSAELIYKAQVGFKDFIGGASQPIYAPSSRHFRPSDRNLSIDSVALYPNDPRRWRTPASYILTRVPTKYEKELGFKKVIGIVDTSGSTRDLFKGRMVLLHEFDVLASLCGFAIDNRLPMDAYVFNSVVVPLRGKPQELLAQALEFTPDGGTSLRLPLDRVHNETDCLIVIITDGEVSDRDVETVGKLTARNKVIGMVVDKDYGTNTMVMTPVKNFTLYTANPGGGQALIFNELKNALM